MKKAIYIASAFWLLLFLAFPAHAQSQRNPCYYPSSSPSSSSGCIPVSTPNPLPVTGSFSAGGFIPSLSYTPLTATASSSASTALPTNTGTVAFQNTSSVDVSCTVATGAASATTNEIIVRGGSTIFVGATGYDHAACINQTGSASNVIVMAGGVGLGTGFGGGSSGGGSSGAVFGPTANGSPAANPPVLMGGTADGSATGNVGNWKVNSSGTGFIDAVTGGGLLNAINAAVPCLNATAFNTNSYSNAGTNPANCDLHGNLYVNGSGVTQPVSATSLPLPTGAATSANQPSLVKSSIPVVNGGNTYQHIAASTTVTLQTSTGAIGDYLSHCVIYPATTAAGSVTVFDNANAATTNVIEFTTGTLSNLAPIAIPVGAVSTAGAWKVTTGANETVVCYGKFS